MIPRARVYKGGKIVIPAFLRKKLNFKDAQAITSEPYFVYLDIHGMVTYYGDA